MTFFNAQQDFVLFEKKRQALEMGTFCQLSLQQYFANERLIVLAMKFLGTLPH